MADSPIRIGNVTAVNEGEMTARVQFPDTGIVSDWLTIMRHKSRVSDDGKTENASGGSGEAAFAAHKHEVKLKHWIPEVGDPVLCVYAEGFNSDGYILGGLTG